MFKLILTGFMGMQSSDLNDHIWTALDFSTFLYLPVAFAIFLFVYLKQNAASLSHNKTSKKLLQIAVGILILAVVLSILPILSSLDCINANDRFLCGIEVIFVIPLCFGGLFVAIVLSLIAAGIEKPFINQETEELIAPNKKAVFIAAVITVILPFIYAACYSVLSEARETRYANARASSTCGQLLDETNYRRYSNLDKKDNKYSWYYDASQYGIIDQYDPTFVEEYETVKGICWDERNYTEREDTKETTRYLLERIAVLDEKIRADYTASTDIVYLPDGYSPVKWHDTNSYDEITTAEAIKLDVPAAKNYIEKHINTDCKSLKDDTVNGQYSWYSVVSQYDVIDKYDESFIRDFNYYINRSECLNGNTSISSNTTENRTQDLLNRIKILDEKIKADYTGNDGSLYMPYIYTYNGQASLMWRNLDTNASVSNTEATRLGVPATKAQ